MTRPMQVGIIIHVWNPFRLHLRKRMDWSYDEPINVSTVCHHPHTNVVSFRDQELWGT